MTKYKIGDYVRIVKNVDKTYFNKYIGDICLVYYVDTDGDVHLKMKDGEDLFWKEHEVELYTFQREQMLELEQIL